MGAFDLVKNIFNGRGKDYSANAIEQSDGVIGQILTRFNQGDSPRMTQSNMGSYLGKYADQAWIYSCIKIIQSKAAGVPLRAYKKQGEDLVEVTDHPLLQLLESVNPYMNGFDLREATHGYIELVGNAYWLKDAIVNGRPTELYPLNPMCIKILCNEKGFVSGYEYRLIPGGQVSNTFKPEEIVHFKTWNPVHPLYGMSPISAARDSSDTIMFSDQYNKAFFKNGAEPGGFLVSDNAVDEDDKKSIMSAWKKMFRGFRRAHNIAVLDNGLKFQPTTTSHKDMAFGELKRMSREDVLTVFGIPPIMVGVFDEANYSNAKEQRRIFWVDCIIPRLRKIESVLNENLVKLYDPSLIIKHDLSGVEDLAEDADARSRTDSYNVAAGIVTVNEVRKLKNLPSVPWGDTWYKPMGTEPVDMSTPNPEDVVVPPVAPAPNQPAPAPEPGKPKPTPAPSKSVDQIDDQKKIRRDALWIEYKGLTERLEGRWAPKLRTLFTEQEREVIAKVRKGDWQKAVRQNRLEKNKRIKQSVDVYLFDNSHWKSIFRKDAHSLMEYTVAASAKEQIDRYDLGIDFNLLDHNVRTWINNKSFRFADEINSTTEDSLRRELSEAIANGETLDQVESRVADVFDIARGSRTAMISRTEVISASNEGAMASYKQSGVVDSSEWITARDNNVRDEHQIDGEEQPLGKEFSNGLMYPGDPSGEASNVINCRCTIAPIVAKGAE